MADLVVLHVGLMKSGTTYLQGRLLANRVALAQEGVLFPGPSWGRQVRAVSDLLGGKRRQHGAWDDLCREINEHRGAAVVSMEFLGPAQAASITKAVGSFPGAEVRVVATVRDLGRSVPAMWQESVKNRASWTWQEYLAGLESGAEAARTFWRQQDSARILHRWAAGAGAGSTHLVTVPPPGAPAGQLWERFSRVCGLPPVALSEAPRANESLGAASSEVLRRINLATTDLSPEQYTKRVKGLGKHVLPRHRGEEDPIGFAVPEWLRQEADRVRTEIMSLGVGIIGDLDDLEPLDVPGVDPTMVTDSDRLEAALAGLATLLHQVKRVR